MVKASRGPLHEDLIECSFGRSFWVYGGGLVKKGDGDEDPVLTVSTEAAFITEPR